MVINMTFGQTIKTLRRDSDMTQEKLAELLAISPQAVSRWETDVAMPDISLLPPIANIFSVTTDYLLGMDTYQKDMRKAEYDEAFYEYWKQEDKEKNYQIALRAATEYPNNMKYVNWLAYAEFYVGAANSTYETFKEFMEKAINHFKIVINDCSDAQLYDDALQGIVLALDNIGRKKEAKEYAMRQDDKFKRDEMLCVCLEGEERIEHLQRHAEQLLNVFLNNLTYVRVIEAYDAEEQILKILFPDENYQYYHNILQYNALSKAICLCNEKRYDEAVNELKKSRFHAEKMAEYNVQDEYCFTAPLFNRVKGNKQRRRSNADIEDFVEGIKNNKVVFEPIREREDFKELMNISL